MFSQLFQGVFQMPDATHWGVPDRSVLSAGIESYLPREQDFSKKTGQMAFFACYLPFSALPGTLASTILQGQRQHLEKPP